MSLHGPHTNFESNHINHIESDFTIEKCPFYYCMIYLNLSCLKLASIISYVYTLVFSKSNESTLNVICFISKLCNHMDDLMFRSTRH